MTELADSMVRIEDITFHQAHGIAGTVARKLIDNALTMADIDYDEFADIFAERVGRPPKLTAMELAHVITPEYFVAVRDRFGGPGPSAMAESLARYERQLNHLRNINSNYLER